MYSVGNGCYCVHEGGALVKSGEEAASPGQSPYADGAADGDGADAGGGAASSGGRQRDERDGCAEAARGFALLSDSCPTTNVPLVRTSRARSSRWAPAATTSGGAAAAAGSASPPPPTHRRRCRRRTPPGDERRRAAGGRPLAPPYSPPPRAASAAVADALAAAAAPPPSYSGTVSWPPASPLAAAATAAGYAPPPAPAAAPPAGLVDATVQLLYEARRGEGGARARGGPRRRRADDHADQGDGARDRRAARALVLVFARPRRRASRTEFPRSSPTNAHTPGTSTTAAGSSHTPNDVPQPHVDSAFGFWKEKPPPISASE